MNLLSVESVSKSYGLKVLFKNITFGIATNQKIALVAKNGAGKTSLLNIITQHDNAESGIVSYKKDINMAYVSQQPDYSNFKTIKDVVYDPKNKNVLAFKNYNDAIESYSISHSDADLKKLEIAQAQMDSLEAWSYEQIATNSLSKLNLHDIDQPINTLSGGQIKRLSLALALAQQPELLILDEPTNHLDIDMIEWLEQLLITMNCAILLVTHDRYFLDRVCNGIIELADTTIYKYDGNFSYYVEKKAEREAIQMSEIDKARNSYFRELEWVRRMPKARTTKSKSRLDAFDDIKAKALQKRNDQALEIKTKMSRLGSKIMEVQGLQKAFDNKKIINDFTYTFKRGEKLGIIGANGVGKSTFLNILMDLEKYDGGTIKHGDTIVYGYYQQKGLVLKEDKRALEVIKDIAEYIPLADGSTLTASSLMTKFLFPPDMQHTYVSKLSGGEKRRLYLLTVLIKNPNFLILDEPTNDLDIATLAVLENFLLDFGGCCIVVTHDRYFMDRLVDQLLIFKGEGDLEFFPGNYSQYSEYLDVVKEEEQLNKDKKPVDKIAISLNDKVEIAADNSLKRKLSFKEKQELDSLDIEVPAMELQKKDLEQELAGSLPHDLLMKKSMQFEKLAKELDNKTLRWLELSELV